MRNLLDKLISILLKIEGAFCTIAFITMTAAAFLQVFFRYVLKSPLDGSEEIARYLMIYMVFVGSAIAVHKQDHISLDIMSVLIGHKKAYGYFKYFLNILGLVFAVVFCYWSFEFFMYAIESKQRTTSLRIPFFIPMSSLLAGSALMVIHFIYHLVSPLLEKYEGNMQRKVVAKQ